MSKPVIRNIQDLVNTHTTQIATKANTADVNTQIASVASGSPKATYATTVLLQTAFPTGNSNIYLVTGNVAEVDALNITAVPTTSGNVTVTLNSVATNVAVTAGTVEVDTLTVSTGATTSGNITITLNGAPTTVAVTAGNTASNVGDAIRATTFTGWTVGGTAGTATVTFTKTTVGTNTTPTFADTGTTGTTASFVVTTAGVNADTATTVATKVRGTSFAGWVTSGTGTSIIFTKSTIGTNTAPLYTAGATGANGTMSVTTAGVNADGKWYYWNASAWTAGGTYQSTGIPNNSITSLQLANNAVNEFKLIGTVLGKNLFNLATITTGYYVVDTNGMLSANASYDVSDYIPVLPSTNYYFNCPRHNAFYDTNKVFISGNANISTFTSPSNAAYIRVSLLPSELPTAQFELGTVGTLYVPYTYSISGLKVLNSNIDSISKDKLDFWAKSKNLFDKTTVTVGYYVMSSNGTLSGSGSYDASDFTPVLPSTQYTVTFGHQMAFYDVNKTYISGVNGNSVYPFTFTTPANAVYVRLTLTPALLNTFQCEIGTLPTSYVPHDEKRFDISTIPSAILGTVFPQFNAFLPSEICVAVGRTIELYNDQVSWCGNIKNYHFKWDCTIGAAMKRKFTVTGTTPLIGEYPLTLTVYDNNMSIVLTTSTVIKIVTNVITPLKNIVTIGDSLSNNKAWLAEFRTLSANQYTLVGTRGTAPLKHEGRSGFSAQNYLQATTYSFEGEGVQPFWDGTRFNWNYYKTNSLVVPDAVQIFLGTNGIDIDATINAGAIKQMVDYIRQDDAIIPIFIVYTLYRGNQDGLGIQPSSDGYAANKGAWELQEDAKVYNLMVMLNGLLSAYSNLHFVPIALAHDSEYNFGGVATPVNPRATQTELLPVEATHPQLQGYQQFADIMFSMFAKYLNS